MSMGICCKPDEGELGRPHPRQGLGLEQERFGGCCEQGVGPGQLDLDPRRSELAVVAVDVTTRRSCIITKVNFSNSSN